MPASAPDKVRIRYGLQPATVRELVASGQQDMTSQWLPPEVMRALAGAPDTHLLTDRGSNILFLHMNTQKAPLDDVNCRLALTYAFDYATAIKLAQITDKVSAATPANGPIGKSEFGYNASLPITRRTWPRRRIPGQVQVQDARPAQTRHRLGHRGAGRGEDLPFS